jgi:hypothetical protein
VTRGKEGAAAAAPSPTLLDAIEHAVDVAQRHGDDALLGNAIDALCVELARRGDPVAQSMLDLDAALAALAVAQLAPSTRATSALRRPLPVGAKEATR